MAEYKVKVCREGKEVLLSGQVGVSLLDTFAQNDTYISAACGGAGKCGKCGVRMTEHPTEIKSADREFFSEAQLAAGWRLSCLTFPETDCTVVIESSDESEFEVITDFQEMEAADAECQEDGYDIAIDIGTTTIAISLIGRNSGKVKCTYTAVNRQRAYGADVIARIQASNEGKGEALRDCIRQDLYDGIHKIQEDAGLDAKQIHRIAIAGNTTMGHLLMGYSCETLGVAPFTPVNIDTIHTTFAELFAGIAGSDEEEPEAEIVLLPGISTYVGADIAAGMLRCGFEKKEKPCLLIDLGTNGEMAIGTGEKILVTSTAAGPAFEGGNISCGMGSVRGAICGVSINGTDVSCQTIGDAPAVGLCGTGVIETVAELLQNEWIDETGMLEEDYFDDGFVLAQTPEGKDISFSQKDVREIQLAKSAVRAGMETLLLRFGVGYEDIDQVFLAGGFGYRMNLDKAIAIGLLPEELHDKIVAVGNSSLGGAVTYLTESDAVKRLDQIVSVSEEIGLSADKDFNRFYTDYMFFE